MEEKKVSEHLEDLTQEILDCWEKEVRKKIPVARRETPSSLRDSIPDFLKDLIRALQTDFDEQAAELLGIAHKHGRERARFTDYSIEDAITEFNILRRVIFQILENKVKITPRDRDIIYECISLGLTKAGAEYANTQLREVELLHTRLKLITDIQPTLIAYLDKDMNYLFANKTFRDWFQVNAEEVLTKNVRDFFPKDLYEEIRRRSRPAFEGKAVRFKHYVNYPIGRKFVDITYQPNFDEAGKVLGIFVSVDDLSEEQAIIERLHNEQDLRDKFISTLSHDLRTPLTASKMSAQIVARKIHDPNIHTHTTKIVENINRADKLIQDMLDASRIRAGKMPPPEVEEFDLIELVKTTLDDLTTIHGDRFRVTGPDKLIIFLNREGIRRILENLANNAVKYGSVTEMVKVTIDVLKDRFDMTILNAGNPHHKVDKSRMFEPFEQGNNGGAGWGIGLTIVKGISEVMGGTVQVASDNKVTTFKVNLPIDARPIIEHPLH